MLQQGTSNWRLRAFHALPNIKRSFYPESCAHPLPTWFFRWAWRIPSWKIHRKSVYFNTPILHLHQGSLPVAQSRMRDLQDLACRLKERGQHLASCLCGMETGGQTRSYNPKRPRQGRFTLYIHCGYLFLPRKDMLPFFPNCYQSQNESHWSVWWLWCFCFRKWTQSLPFPKELLFFGSLFAMSNVSEGTSSGPQPHLSGHPEWKEKGYFLLNMWRCLKILFKQT